MSIDNMKLQVQGLFEESKANADTLFEHPLDLSLSASADASTAVDEHGWTPIPFDGTVVGVKVTQSGTIADSTTAYAEIQLIKRDAAGANNATVAARATNSADDTNQILAYAGWALTITPANAEVVAGGSLSLAVAKTGSGVSTTAGKVVVLIRRKGS